VFRPESVDDAPPQVLALRAEFEAADGVIVAIPEYGGGAAGWAKNALDWMIGSGSLYQRPVVVVCAGTTGGPNAIEQIARTLTWQGASVVATLGIAAPLTKIDTSGALTDVDTIAALDQVVSLLLIATRAGDAELAEFAAAAVTPLGIHPTDRTGR
jgi:NAD(P)H-dependent FMN reductase